MSRLPTHRWVPLFGVSSASAWAMSSCWLGPGQLIDPTMGGAAGGEDRGEPSAAAGGKSDSPRGGDAPPTGGASSGGRTAGQGNAGNAALGGSREDCVGEDCHRECLPQQAHCKNDQELTTCTTEGVWEIQTCAAGCIEDRCDDPCLPRAVRCVDEQGAEAPTGISAQRCEGGTWAAFPCQKGEICSKGACLGAPTVVAFSSSQGVIHPQEEVFVQWTLEGGAPESLTIEPDIGKALSPSARSVSFVPGRSGEYTLRATNAAGVGTRSLRVEMSPRGTLDRILEFGPVGDSQGLALSPSGRVVAVARANATYTHEALRVEPGDAFVAELDLEQSSVVRVQIPQYVLTPYDITFGGEDLYVAGDSRGPNDSNTDAQNNAVARLDPQLQTVGHLFYAIGEGTKQFAEQVVAGPQNEILVRGYSPVAVNSSLVQLDSRLVPQLDGDSLDGIDLPPGHYWQDLAIDEKGSIFVLRLSPQISVERVTGTTADSELIPFPWLPPLAPFRPMAIAALSPGVVVVVGSHQNQGYIGLVSSESHMPEGSDYPGAFSETRYDELEFRDVCIDAASRIIVAGVATIGSEDAIFVHAFVRNGALLEEAWDEPVLFGDSEGAGSVDCVVCDPRGYALVSGSTAGAQPLVLRIK